MYYNALYYITLHNTVLYYTILYYTNTNTSTILYHNITILIVMLH